MVMYGLESDFASDRDIFSDQDIFSLPLSEESYMFQVNIYAISNRFYTV